MAFPVLDSVTPPAVTLAPGQFVDVVINAHDPDSGSGAADVPISDAGGHVTTAHVAITLADPITFGTAVVSGVAVTVTRTAVSAASATYRFQA